MAVLQAAGAKRVVTAEDMLASSGLDGNYHFCKSLHYLCCVLEHSKLLIVGLKTIKCVVDIL